jgi:hypothetical protein
LLLVGGKVFHGSTGLVHVTAELVSDLEPLGLGDIGGQLVNALGSLSKDILLSLDIFGVTSFVEGVRSGLSIDRVRGVKRRRLIRSVCGTLRVGATISNQTENRESRRFSGSGIGDGRNECGTGGGDSCQSITAGCLLKGGNITRMRKVRQGSVKAL